MNTAAMLIESTMLGKVENTIVVLLTALLIALFACGWYTFGFSITLLIWTAPAAIVYGILITICGEWSRRMAMANYRHDQEEEHRRRQEDRWDIEERQLEQDRSRQEERWEAEDEHRELERVWQAQRLAMAGRAVLPPEDRS